MEHGLIVPAGKIVPVAVLVDGENIHATRATDVLALLDNMRPQSIRRAYGNIELTHDWETKAGFRLFHSGTAKNAADMALAMDAMVLAYEGGIGHFVLVTSDGDFSHLAHGLRERGHEVTEIGEEKAPARFRKACTRFIALKQVTQQPEPMARTGPSMAPKPGSSTITPNLPAGAKDPLERIVIDILATQAGASGVGLTDLNAAVRAKSQIRITATLEKNWRNWLTARSGIFYLDAKGPKARVRLLPARP